MTLNLRPTEPWERYEPAAPTVTLTYARDRTRRGEIRVRVHYLAADDRLAVRRTHRVYLGGPFPQALRALWDTIFDATCAVQHAAAAPPGAGEAPAPALHLDLRGLAPGWRLCVRTIAEIVAYELGVAVTGAVDDVA